MCAILAGLGWQAPAALLVREGIEWLHDLRGMYKSIPCFYHSTNARLSPQCGAWPASELPCSSVLLNLMFFKFINGYNLTVH